MLTQPQVQRYSNEAGLRDIMIAEKEIILTFLLELLSDRGILNITRIEEHDHEEVILAMLDAFEQPFHGIQFAIPDQAYYESENGLSWGVNPTYSHVESGRERNQAADQPA